MHNIKIVSTFSGLTLCLEKSQDRSMAKGAPGVAFLYTRPRKWSRLNGYEFLNLKLKWYLALIFSNIVVMAQEVLHVRDWDLQSTLGLDHGQRRTRRWNLLQNLLRHQVRHQRIRFWIAHVGKDIHTLVLNIQLFFNIFYAVKPFSLLPFLTG